MCSGPHCNRAIFRNRMERRTPARSRDDSTVTQTQDFGKMDGRPVLPSNGNYCNLYRAVLYASEGFTVTVHYKYHSTGLGVRNETKRRVQYRELCPSPSRRPCHHAMQVPVYSMPVQACAVRCLISLLRVQPHSRPHSSDRSRRKGAGNNKWYTVRGIRELRYSSLSASNACRARLAMSALA